MSGCAGYSIKGPNQVNEPIYSFVPGSGWIVCSAHTFLWKGELWKIEHRRPEMHEYFEWVFAGSRWVTETGEPNFEKFIQHVLESGGRTYSGMGFQDSDVVVTITKV